MLFIVCSPLSQIVADEFVGIPDDEFREHYRAQQGQLLCWATCAEMVLSHQGIELKADAIVKKIKGRKVDASGSPLEMIKSTNGLFQDQDDNDVVISGQMVAGAPLSTVLYNSLKKKKPIILLYQNGPWMGHAVVLTGADVRVNKLAGEIEVQKFHIFDPFCYRLVVDFKGRRLEEDDKLIKKTYHPRVNFNQLRIEPGVVSAVILIDGTKL